MRPRVVRRWAPQGSPERSRRASSTAIPRLELWPRRRARMPARASIVCIRATGSPIELTELDARAPPEYDAAIVAYPHGAAAPRSLPRFLETGVPASTSRPTSACTTRPSTRRPTASTARPSSWPTRSTASPSSIATRSAGARLVANPGCDPTAAHPGPRADDRGGAARGRGDQRRFGRLGRRPGRRGPAALRLRGRELHALRGRWPPPSPRDRAGARWCERRSRDPAAPGRVRASSWDHRSRPAP